MGSDNRSAEGWVIAAALTLAALAFAAYKWLNDEPEAPASTPPRPAAPEPPAAPPA